MDRRLIKQDRNLVTVAHIVYSSFVNESNANIIVTIYLQLL